MRFRLLICILCLSVLVLPGCFHEPEEENLSLIKRQLVNYVKSGKYAGEIAAVVDEAKDFLEARVAASASENTGKVAIVLDIDDTAISGMPNLLANDFGLIKGGRCTIPKGPCGWSAWQERAEAPVIAPTLELSRVAKKLGFAVFFISGRHEKYRVATERNLRAAGYESWDGLILRTVEDKYPSEADFKAPARGKLEQEGYVIVLNMGDQESDLAGGYAERAFKLPNPFYLIP